MYFYQDHPRLCGKESFDPEDIDEDGITPAYAGKSTLCSKVERNDGDHPRLCGEKC